MNNIDFNNTQGSNLGDPKFGQDAVNLRTAQRMINNLSIFTGLTSTTIFSTAVTTSSVVTNEITASTATVGYMNVNSIQVELLTFVPINYSPVPSKGLMFFDDFTTTLYFYTGNSFTDLVALT